MQTVVWLHSVCMWHYQIHQNLKRQQSVNVPADKMHSYISQNSYLIPVEGRFAGKTMIRDSKNSTVTPANTGHAGRQDADYRHAAKTANRLRAVCQR